MINKNFFLGKPGWRAFALVGLMTALALLSACSKKEQTYGNSASDRALASAAALKAERDPVMAKAQALADANQGSEALDALEVYLKAHPDDIVAGNLYRKLATKANLFDRPIKFFVAIVKELTPCPKEPPVCPENDKDCGKKELERCSPTAQPPGPPSGIRYNLAFAYIDKIPVVGPMGAGFLSKRSIEQFKKALDEDKDDWIANYGIGMNYLHWPDYFEKNDSSIAYFENSIKLQEARAERPSDILAYVRLGDAHAKAGAIAKAQEAWKRGEARVGKHGDLEERLQIDAGHLKQAVLDAYNPNNSIGAINTDISILWAENMPERVFSLKNPDGPVVIGGVGGQSLPEQRKDYSEARLFNWFRDNLPLLLNRENADKVDMSGIGATGGKGAGIIAYNMIKGFMTQFKGEKSEDVADQLAKSPSYERPFFHEGVGMGLAAALDTSADGSLTPFAGQIAAFDSKFDRLQYAGLGMWYGLAPTINLVRVRNKLGELDLRGQFYAYEGMGFAVALFKDSVETGAVDLVQRLPYASGSTFAHGVGRALWIKYGDDTASLNKTIAAFPEQFRPDLRDGFGMGVAFTRIDQPDVILEQAANFRKESPAACLDYLGGAAMGLAIRNQNDPSYVADMLKLGAAQTKQTMQNLLQAGLNALDETQKAGVEMHRNWRTAIHAQIADGKLAAGFKKICEGKMP
jgi:tetratricopeptide (TPR) repeat protein